MKRKEKNLTRNLSVSLTNVETIIEKLRKKSIDFKNRQTKNEIIIK